MNWEMLKGAVERLATVLVAWAVGRGYVPQAVSADLIALIVILGSVGWGIYTNRMSNLVQATAGLPDVNKVVVKASVNASELTKPGATVTNSCNPFAVVCALGLSLLLLSACASSGTVSSSATTTNAQVEQVRKTAVQICGYLPLASTVVNIFASSNPLLTTSVGVAQAICNAVTNRPLADGPGDRTPRVGNVVVRGKFVR